MLTTSAGISLNSIEFCEDSSTYTATYDKQSTSPSMAVVGAVADALDTDPLELEPLYKAVDADAIDALLQRASEESVNVSFRFANCEITMSGDGRIQFTTPEA